MIYLNDPIFKQLTYLYYEYILKLLIIRFCQLLHHWLYPDIITTNLF